MRRGLRVESPVGEEGASDLCLGGAQLASKELCGDGVGLDQSCALPRRLRDRSPTFDIAQLDARATGEFFDRLGEGKVIDLLQEVENVTALTAPEAVPHAATRGDMETGRALIVKWAQPLE